MKVGLKMLFCEKNKEVIVTNSEKLSVLCPGDVKITTMTDNFEYDITLEDVVCLPSMTANLLSVSQLVRKGCSVYNKKEWNGSHSLISQWGLQGKPI